MNGEEIALFRYGPHVVALSDICSHAGGSIHLGDIEEVGVCVCCQQCPALIFLVDGARAPALLRLNPSIREKCGSVTRAHLWCGSASCSFGSSVLRKG